MMDRFALAERVIREAGALALRHAGRLAELDVRSKGSQDMVTEADLEIELLLRQRLLEAFPDDRFFGTSG
jgi:myo-inositol-1(or 4)-monophosphatase